MVVVRLAIEVGRIGAPTVTVACVVEVEVGGHSTPVPQSRPLVQQPPPRLAGQDWKPGEQVIVTGADTLLGIMAVVDVLIAVVVVDVGTDVDVGVAIVDTRILVVAVDVDIEIAVADVRVLVLGGRDTATVW